MDGEDQVDDFEQARAGLPDISPEMSVIWKPLRRLLEEGSPIDPVTVLFYNMGDGRNLPFASIAKTRGNRLILWPPSHALAPHEFDDGRAFPIDHITLDLWNGKTHFTRFDQRAQRDHEDDDWQLAGFEGGLKLWMIGAFSVALLEKQVGVLAKKMQFPEKKNPNRREEEVRRYVAGMERVVVNTPPLRGDCFVTVIHLLPDSITFDGPVKPAHFPMGSFWDDWIDGWTDGDNFSIGCTQINVDRVNLLLLTASPCGQLKEPCIIGSISNGPNN